MRYQKNDELKLRIDDMSVDGEGIGHADGMTFFVKDAVVGDEVLCGVTKMKKTYGYARLLEVLTPSPHRVTPPCPVAKQCGGCQLQAVSYEYQLALKERRVRQDLIRIGKFSEEEVDAVMRPIMGMEMGTDTAEPSHTETVAVSAGEALPDMRGFRYRNKAQFPVGADTGGLKNGESKIGFYAAHSHRIVPIEDCLLLHPVNAELVKTIKEYMQTYGISAYDETTGKGVVRHILTRVGFRSGQIMVCLVINGKKLPYRRELIDLLTTDEWKARGMTSIVLNYNSKNTNVILGDRTEMLWGSDVIEDMLRTAGFRPTVDRGSVKTAAESVTRESIRFRISPQSFYQVNPVQTEKLYAKALECANLTGEEIVWDLYCGIGTISLFLAKQVKHVYGVEVVPEAIANANENAKVNGITNATFFVGKAEEINVPAKTTAEQPINLPKPDVIVIDPPRKGCEENCLKTILEASPKRIVYISCDPATLARDCRVLCDGGYALETVTPCDMFPQTGHVETVCLLSNRKPDTKVSTSESIDQMMANS